MICESNVSFGEFSQYVSTEEVVRRLQSDKYYRFHLNGYEHCIFLKWGESVKASNLGHCQTIILPCSGALGQVMGGSVCKTYITMRDGKWVVVKRALRDSRMGSVDGYERHLGEAVWICSREVHQSGLFPNTEYAVDEGGLTMVSEFVPGDTLGEVMWGGRHSVQRIVEMLSYLFEQLSSKLYIHTASYGGENYILKIQRRWGYLCSSESEEVWSGLLTKPLVLNGREMPSLSRVLEIVQSSYSYVPLNELVTPKMCHGDLIPEDVLVDSNLTQFMLIDPNPQNADPIADWSKILMSIKVYYDLALRDKLKLEYADKDDCILIDYSFEDDTEEYLQLMRDLAIALLHDDSEFLARAARINSRVTGRTLLINAGLMALSIAPFHALQHRNLKRALYFYARASEILSEAV